MRNVIDKQQLKELVDNGKSYKEISEILHYNETSLCRCYTKNFGKRLDRAASYRQKIDITKEQEEIIFGSLLGDMCIVKHVKTYRGSECHSVKQVPYIEYKYNLLRPLCGKLLDSTTTIKGKTYYKKQFVLRPNLNLAKFYNMFYINENLKKDVPYDLSLLTPRAIAFWFMDDGFHVTNKNNILGFSTCSFSLEGLMRLQSYLKITYNIDTIIRKNFYLIVRTNSYQILYNLIRPYIIPSMLYKLGLS